MPANLSPEFKLAEAAYRKARDPKERLLHLREMLRVIPKHKGTEHLQADIKGRVKDLTGELEHGPKGDTRSMSGVTACLGSGLDMRHAAPQARISPHVWGHMSGVRS